jgi:hypothetical protein
MTTGRPRSDARSKAVPSRVVPEITGAGRSIAACSSRSSRLAPLTNSQTPTVVRTAMERAMRIGRRGVM